MTENERSDSRDRSAPITSRHNQRLKELRKLSERKHRDRSGLFVAEGEDLLAEARRFGASPRVVFYDPDSIGDADPLLAGALETLPVAADALHASSGLGSGTRVAAVFEQSLAGLDALRSARLALYLHEVSDPGNVGAILRSALALADAAVVLSPGCADPYGPKAVRASMGAVFGQPVARAGFERTFAALAGEWRSVALVPHSGRPLHELEPATKVLYCLGSERLGLPAELVAACDEVAHVPLRSGGVESLNVAITATLCLYHEIVHTLSGSS
jgi:TrmH family RNA methyltransferase